MTFLKRFWHSLPDWGQVALLTAVTAIAVVVFSIAVLLTGIWVLVQL